MSLERDLSSEKNKTPTKTQKIYQPTSNYVVSSDAEVIKGGHNHISAPMAIGMQRTPDDSSKADTPKKGRTDPGGTSSEGFQFRTMARKIHSTSSGEIDSRDTQNTSMMIEDKFLHAIADEVEVKAISVKLARTLGVPDTDIDDIVKKHTNEPYEQSYQLLKKWKTQLGHKATLLGLYFALLKHKLMSVVDEHFQAYLRPEEAMCKKDFDSEIKAYLAKNSEDAIRLPISPASPDIDQQSHDNTDIKRKHFIPTQVESQSATPSTGQGRKTPRILDLSKPKGATSEKFKDFLQSTFRHWKKKSDLKETVAVLCHLKQTLGTQLIREEADLTTAHSKLYRLLEDNLSKQTLQDFADALSKDNHYSHNQETADKIRAFIRSQTQNYDTEEPAQNAEEGPTQSVEEENGMNQILQETEPSINQNIEDEDDVNSSSSQETHTSRDDSSVHGQVISVATGSDSTSKSDPLVVTSVKPQVDSQCTLVVGRSSSDQNKTAPQNPKMLTGNSDKSSQTDPASDAFKGAHSKDYRLSALKLSQMPVNPEYDLTDLLVLMKGVGRLSMSKGACFFINLDKEFEQDEDQYFMFTSCECLFHSREEWEDWRGLGVDQIKKICQICRDRLNVVHLSTNITFKENGVPLKKILSLKLKDVVTHSGILGVSVDWLPDEVTPLSVHEGDIAPGSILAVLQNPTDERQKNHFVISIGLCDHKDGPNELYYTMKATPGSPIFLLKSRDDRCDLGERYWLIGVHCSNPTGDCTLSRGIKLNKQFLQKFGMEP